MDYKSFKQVLKNGQNIPVSEKPDALVTNTIATPTALSIDKNALQQKTEEYLKEIIAKEAKLPVERLQADEPFEKYGIDSVMIMNLNRQLEGVFGDLPKTLLFEYQTTQALANYFIENHSDTLAKKLLPDVTPSDEPPPMAATPSVAKLRFKAESRLQAKPAKAALHDVAIIGMSGRYPQAPDLKTFWDNLKAGRDSITEIPKERWDLSRYFDTDKYKAGTIYSKWGGFIDDIDKFDPLFFNISPADAEFIDPQERLFLETSWQVIEDAGYSREGLSGQKIGVFVGVMYGEYQLFGAEESLKGHVMATSAAFASIANRVSYYLNFHGPSIALDTMCSSSLTSIHLACKSIRDGECQLALAGGVNVSVHPNKYILLSQGKFLASDGHCHSFGDGGDGYVPGEGVGAVLLKPLEQAIADGDHIYGIIKGSSINHGGKTNGYTVPNPVAQGDLIEENFRHAGVNPETISYVEAHGTGTALGDPIEISGLSKVFGNKPRDNPVAIGSVKSNIGHLESAAGIAAVTKVLLQMQHKALVPSIYSDTLNPHINWEKTPFKVQHDFVDWKQPVHSENGIEQDIPRRAGISAFGAGGSNAHLIIEEGPELPDSQAVPQATYLISLSAKTDAALQQRMRDLAEWLAEHDEASLQAISYTLNIGRSHFDKRVALVVSNSHELKEMLLDIQSGKQVTGYFQGDASKKAHDAPLPAPDYSDLKTLASIYSQGYDFDWKQLYPGESPRKISLPTYPFARKRYWIEKSGEPLTALADSPGIAGLHPLLDSNESTFTEQIFRKTLQPEAFYLHDHVIKGRVLLPGAAYLEMARAAGYFAAHRKVTALKDVLWLSPVVLEQSSLDLYIRLFPDEPEATWQVYSEAAGVRTVYCEGRISYDEELLTETRVDLASIRARCSRVIEQAAIYERLKTLDFDYGPTFQVTKRMHSNEQEVLAELEIPAVIADTASNYVLHPSLIDGALRAILGLHFHSSEPLPLRIPFAMDALRILQPLNSKCYVYATSNADKVDVTICNDEGEASVIIRGFAARELKAATNSNSELLIYTPEWLTEAIRTTEKEALDECLIFVKKDQSRQGLEQLAKRVIWVTPASAYRQVSESAYEIRIDEPADYRQLFSDLACHGSNRRYLLHAFNLDNDDNLHGNLNDGLYSLVHLFKALGTDGEPVRCLFAWQSEQPAAHPVYDMVTGFMRAFKLLKPFWQFTSVQLDAASRQLPIWPDYLANEMSAETSQTVRYSNGQRQVRRLQAINSAEYAATPTQSPLLRLKGVYLLTGGLGGLGQLFAEYLAGHYQARLVLMGRRAMTAELKRQLAALEQQGAEVLYVSGDVSSLADVARMVADAKSRFGPLNGVLHIAGVASETPFAEVAFDDFKAVLAPKVVGTLNLDLATQAEPLDFFVGFSSVAAEAGDQGVGSYAAGNRFLDSFLALREQRQKAGQRFGKSLSINWPWWSAGGMQLEGNAEESVYTDFTGMQPLNRETGLALFNRLLSLPYSQLLAVEGERHKVEWLLGLDDAPVASAATVESDADLLPVAENYLKAVLSTLLKIPTDELESQRSFEEYGMDSVIIVKFNQLLDKDFSHLRKTLLFEYSTIAGVATYLAGEQRAQLERITGLDKKTPDIKPVKTVIQKPLPGILLKKSSPLLIPVQEEAIAIIGISGRYPQAENLDEFWENLKAGRDCIEEIPLERWDYRPYFNAEKNTFGKMYAKWGGFIADADKFDPMFFKISPLEAEQMNPQERLMLQTAWATIEDAGYSQQLLHQSSGGRVGVFMGLMWNEYQLLQQRTAVLPTYGSSNTSSLANRVSYFLDLHGPSLVIDTMCSSSLVAIHMACESIMRGECAYALAGGANLSLHPSKYVNLSDMGMLASDGRCKSFSAGGDGYVPGEGIGAVLLKPLSRALQDGDVVYGVIKGSNVNHGGKTNSYTVPAPDAQAELIASALKKANITPESLSYVEAHGTGTSLGDPIEVTGLYKAFGNEVARQSCPLGSVKSNVGHLEGAAGIVALTKVLLQLKHKQLVPSLHAEVLNPFIDFTQTPFYVQRELSDWIAAAGFRRRAGISSFGAGGTNAYLIIEEAPEREARQSANKPVYVLCLSAKTNASLQQRIIDLATWLARHEDASLEAVSYTLNIGRSHFDKRAAFVVSSIEELQSKLAGQQKGVTLSGYFQGDASKKPDDAAIYKRVLKITLEDLQMGDYTNTGDYKEKLEALANLYVKGYELDWGLLHQGESSRRISLPGYPFAREHYWTPLPDAAPAGLHPLLDNNTSTLESLSFTKLFTGNEFYLSNHHINHVATLPGVVYLEMARAAGVLAAPGPQVTGLKNIIWASPIQIKDAPQTASIYLYPDEDEVAFEVTTQGTHVHAEGTILYGLPDTTRVPAQLDRVAIQARCLQHQAKDDIYTTFNQLGLQYGPAFQVINEAWHNEREVIAQLRLLSDSEGYLLHPVLLDGALQTIALLAGDSRTSAVFLPFSIGKIDIWGSLPAQCFVYSRNISAADHREMQTFQIQIADEAGNVLIDIHDFTVRAVSMDAMEPARVHYYQPEWKQATLPVSQNTFSGPVLVIDDDERLVLQLRQRFPEQVIVWARSGEVWQLAGEYDYVVTNRQTQDYQQLLQHLEEHNRLPQHIIYHVALPIPTELTDVVIQGQLQQSYYPLFYLAQALVQLKLKKNIQLFCINERQGHGRSLFAEALTGFTRTLHLEQPGIMGRVITCHNCSEPQIVALLMQELTAVDTEIRYEKNTRLIKQYCEIMVPENSDSPLLLKKKGVYLITGGAGGLGLIFARFLAEHYQARLILTGRSALNIEQTLVISELEQLGSEVMYARVDVTKRADLGNLLDDIKSRFGALHGIIHSAGVLRDAFILKKTTEDVADVLAPKIYGSLYLDEITQSEPLDFFVLFSSIASVFGSVGQCDYAYANHFMDEFALHREALHAGQKRQGKTVSINWPLWAEGGMNIDASSRELLEKMFGAAALSTEEGIKAFVDALAQGNMQQIVLPGQATKLQTLFAKTCTYSRATDIRKSSGVVVDANLHQKTVAYLKQVIATAIKLPPERLDENELFEQYGIDSVVILKLNSELQQRFGELPRTLLFEYQTLQALAGFFVENYSEVLTNNLLPQNTSHGVALEPHFVKKTRIAKTKLPTPQSIDAEAVIENYKKTFLNYSELNISLVRVSADIDMEVIQTGKGEVVFLLPPWGCISTAWRHQFETLSRHYHVISIHYPGCGRSGIKGDVIDFSKLADLLMEAMTKIGISMPLHVVGWSMGGIIAQYIVQHYPERIKTLTLVNSTAKLPEEKQADVNRIMLSFQEDFDLSQQHSQGDLLTMSQINGISSPDVEALYYRKKLVFDRNEMLEPASVPMLVIGGGRDKIMPLNSSGLFLGNNVNEEYHILKSAGHYIPLFSPEYFDKLLIAFLKK